MRSKEGPFATLGSSARARVRLTIRCRNCRHRAEPDPDEQAERYGPETILLDWKARLVCSRCGSREIDLIVTGDPRY